MPRFLPRPTYANVMATAAMFVALGGTSYAVTKLPKKSVGTAQLRDKAVTKAKLADGVVIAGPAGANGARGPRGEQGPKGDTGAQGPTGGVAQAGAWQSLGLANPWSNFGDYQIGGFRKDASGTVQLRGVIKNAAGPSDGSLIATLPAGYRPALSEVFVVSSGDSEGEARINVNPDGGIVWYRGPKPVLNYTSLSGIFFTPAS